MISYFSWFSTKETIESRETQFFNILKLQINSVFNLECFNMKCLEFGISILFISLSSACLRCLQIKDQVGSEITYEMSFLPISFVLEGHSQKYGRLR